MNLLVELIFSVAMFNSQKFPITVLNKTMFENIEVEIPKIEIQNKIAKILSKLDDKIKLNNEINNNLCYIT